MYEYQDVGIEFLRSHERALLADDPGLGKTRQLLLAAEGRTLVVAPAYLSGVWEDECAHWTPSLDVSFCSYGSLCDRAPDKKGRLTRSLPEPRRHLREVWDTLIFDESHHLKNPRAMWTKAAVKLFGDRMFLSTGTPIPNWAHELIVPLRMLYPGDRRFTDYWRWVKRWFITWQPPWGGTKIEDLKPQYTWDQFYRENGLADRMLRRRREDVQLDLPPLTEQVIEVDMTPAQRRVYKALKKDYVTWVEETGTEISAWSDGGLHTKLAKIQTGLELVDPGAHGSGKLDMLEQLLGDHPEPIVVYGHFRATVDAAAGRATKLGRAVGILHGGVAPLARVELVRQFQRGELDCLVGTLDSMSEGLTLTAAPTAIFVERSWRPTRNEQARRRLHRIGQTQPVSIIQLVTRQSLDGRMLTVLGKKTDQQVKAFRAGEFAALLGEDS